MKKSFKPDIIILTDVEALFLDKMMLQVFVIIRRAGPYSIQVLDWSRVYGSKVDAE